MGGEPLIRRVATTFLESGVDEVLVVLGANGDAIERVLTGLRVRPVRNEGWAAGMLSSVRAGLAALDGRSTLVAISPADLPHLTSAAVAGVLSAARRQHRAPEAVEAVVPTFEGRRGHPLVVSRNLLDRVLAWGDERRLSDLLREPDVRVVELSGFGPEVLRDVDVPADLEPGR